MGFRPEATDGKVSIVFPEIYSKGMNEVTQVEIVDSDAFKECTMLASVQYPSSLKEIRKGAFVGCPNLEPCEELENGTIDPGAYKEGPGTRGNNGESERNLSRSLLLVGLFVILLIVALFVIF